MKSQFKFSYYIFYFAFIFFIIWNPLKAFSATSTTNGQISIQNAHCYPNPFDKNKEITTITFQIIAQKTFSQNPVVTIVIYDYNGKKVWTKQIQQVLPNTPVSVPWGGESDLGNKVANGLYYGKIIVEGSNTLAAIVKILVK